MNALRLGAVRYLNALPLIEGLAEDPRVSDLQLDLPSQLEALLESGRVDCILGPVKLLVDHPSWSIVPGAVIGCEGPVDTVLIRSDVPPTEISHLRADPASRTSNVLARIVLEAMRGGERVEVGEGLDAPAQVIIGDAAFEASIRDAPYLLDLGTCWKDLTGLPFAFAAWIAADASAAEQAAPVVREAAQLGQAKLERIAAEHSESHGSDRGGGLVYLRDRLKYDLDERMQQGLDEFLKRARELD